MVFNVFQIANLHIMLFTFDTEVFLQETTPDPLCLSWKAFASVSKLNCSQNLKSEVHLHFCISVNFPICLKIIIYLMQYIFYLHGLCLEINNLKLWFCTYY